MKEIGFEVLDHPADMGLKVWAPSLDSLFSEAAIALTDSIFDLDLISQEFACEVELSSSELDLLMYDWLSEVLFLFDAEGKIFSKFEIIDIVQDEAEINLKAKMYGETYNPEKHQVKTYVKAITMHQLKIESSSNQGLSKATIYLDI